MKNMIAAVVYLCQVIHTRDMLIILAIILCFYIMADDPF